MHNLLYIPVFIVTVLALLMACCQLVEQAATASLSPVETVEAFYTWYLDYINPGSEDMRNPLVDRAYRNSPYLTQAKIESVDALLESFAQQGGGGFDPFLLAQDIPQAVQAELATQAPDSASVIVREQFGESLYELQASLVLQDGRWVIDETSQSEQ